MRCIVVLGVEILGLVMAGCAGGAVGTPQDDIGDIMVLTHSPGNGDQLDEDDSLDGFNALNNPTLTNPGTVTLVFSNSVDGIVLGLKLTSVQAAQVKDVVEWTNRRIDDLLTLPGPEGKSPRSVAEERQRLAKELVPEHARGSVSVSVKPVLYRRWSIPGRECTYGDELNRIETEGYEQIKRLLSDEQRKEYESTSFCLFRQGP